MSEFELLTTFAFTSERKMMSVVLIRKYDGKAILYTKGADTAILPKVYNNNGINSRNRLD